MLPFLIDFFWCSSAALLTSFLINKYMRCAVQSSSGVSFLLCILSYALTKNTLSFPIIFGGSFIGMSLFKKFHPLELVVASAIFSLIYIMMLSELPPIGGVLGFSAFISLGFILVIKFIFQKIKAPTS